MAAFLATATLGVLLAVLRLILPLHVVGTFHHPVAPGNLAVDIGDLEGIGTPFLTMVTRILTGDIHTYMNFHVQDRSTKLTYIFLNKKYVAVLICRVFSFRHCVQGLLVPRFVDKGA